MEDTGSYNSNNVEWVQLTSRFESSCVKCKLIIYKGVKMEWRPDTRASRHLSCPNIERKTRKIKGARSSGRVTGRVKLTSGSR